MTFIATFTATVLSFLIVLSEKNNTVAFSSGDKFSRYWNHPVTNIPEFWENLECDLYEECTLAGIPIEVFGSGQPVNKSARWLNESTTKPCIYDPYSYVFPWSICPCPPVTDTGIAATMLSSLQNLQRNKKEDLMGISLVLTQNICCDVNEERSILLARRNDREQQIWAALDRIESSSVCDAIDKYPNVPATGSSNLNSTTLVQFMKEYYPGVDYKIFELGKSGINLLVSMRFVIVQKSDYFNPDEIYYAMGLKGPTATVWLGGFFYSMLTWSSVPICWFDGNGLASLGYLKEVPACFKTGSFVMNNLPVIPSGVLVLLVFVCMISSMPKIYNNCRRINQSLNQLIQEQRQMLEIPSS